MSNYADFIRGKSQSAHNSGFSPTFMPDFLFDFQKALVEWAVIKGRAAIFADCGLGKTPMQLVWAENVRRFTNKPVLILTPLAVGAQTVREGEKFGIECHQSREGKVMPGLTVTNYERLHYFNPDDFAGCVCDEASILKAFDGKRRKQVTRFLSKMKYRLLCTATAAPNDFIELGTLSEALGEMGQSEMLGMYFRNDDKTNHTMMKNGDFWNRHKWHFKAHAELPFWRWVCSWSRSLRSPADIGFDGSLFVLPPLEIQQHVVSTAYLPPGELFPRIARTLAEQRDERKRTMQERCERVASLVNHDQPAVVWCQYNDEGDILEKLIPGCIQVAGRHSDEDKEEKLTAFSLNQVRCLVTKPKIGSYGLNWQHCGHHSFFPSHSFEQYYQATRRSLRFGRVGPVHVDIVTTEGEAGVTANLEKKQAKADQMFTALVAEMGNANRIAVENLHVNEMESIPWL